MIFSKSILLALLPTLAVALNDWTIPCTSGTCSYDSGDGKNTAWSSLLINALSPDALSDITSAAGWEILNCDEKSTDPQDIRLVCVDQGKGCSHLFEGGADDTIIRLPESCAGGPFARVTRTWVDKDQNLPARLAKRGQTSGQVRGLALDFDFAKIPETRGKVYMTVAATNSPAQRDVIRSAAMKRSLQPFRHANRRDQAAAVIRDFASPPTKRSPSIFDDIAGAFDKVVDTVKDGAQAVGNFFGQTGESIGDGFNKVVDAAKTGDIGKIIDTATGAVFDFVQAAGDASRFDKTVSKFSDPINVDKTIPIIDQPVDCSGGTGSVPGNFKIDASVKASVTAHIGFIVTGTVVPINIEKLAFTGGLGGNADATFTVSANAQGTLTTPSIRVFEFGIPGLDFPGIISVGPSFSINAFAEADLDIVADLSLGASLDLSQMLFAFPASAGSSTADIKPKDSPLKIDVGPSDLALTANFTLHLIPRIDIGVTILGGAAKATVFADVDATAQLDLSLNARTTGKQADGSAAKTDVGGTVGMKLGISSKVGAEAALQPFFDAGANVQLFQKTFDLFTKDFGTLPPPKPEVDPAAEAAGAAPTDQVDPNAPVGPGAVVDPVGPAAAVKPTAPAAPTTSVGPAPVTLVPVNPVPIPVKRSVLPGRHSKRLLSCANPAAVRGLLSSVLNVVAAAPK